MDEDLERAGPSMDSQRDEKVRGKATVMLRQSSTPTAAENAALVDAWTHKLQTLTLVTTFLASIDGELFTLTNTQSQVTVNASPKSQEFVYSCFASALIFHVCASILGYAGSFALIQYKLIDADVGERSREPNEHLSSAGKHRKRPPTLGPLSPFLQMPPDSLLKFDACSRTFSAPLPLLTRCYHTTLVLGGAGFVAALIGIATYAWKGLQQTVGIVTVACLGVSVVAGIWAIL